jgi:hypothetical protein
MQWCGSHLPVSLNYEPFCSLIAITLLACLLACSNFDRFAVDPLLDLKQIGPILDRNDLRVADVSIRTVAMAR